MKNFIKILLILLILATIVFKLTERHTPPYILETPIPAPKITPIEVYPCETAEIGCEKGA